MMITYLLHFSILSLSLCFGSQQSFHVQYQWNYVNFTWPSSKIYQNAINKKLYIPENNAVSGIKIWKDDLYLTIPRYKDGVPATLVSTSLHPIDNKISPLLKPFPNWKMQKLDDCSGFQYVQSMEIDPLGRMWILDNGRTEFEASRPRVKCPARLVVLDLENQNKKVLDYRFPNNVVNISSVELNDIVLDHEDGGYAYITDTDPKFPGVIVFSLQSKTSWKVTHKSMKADRRASKLVVNGTTLSFLAGTDGIALSPASTEGFRTLYYSPLTSYDIYSVPVNQLKKRNKQSISRVGRKTSQTDGMFMTNDGNLFFGILNQDTVAVWNTHRPFEERPYFHDGIVNQWPDSFATSIDGYLYWTSNRLQRSKANQVNINEPNYRVVTSKIYARNYQYYLNGSAPYIR